MSIRIDEIKTSTRQPAREIRKPVFREVLLHAMAEVKGKENVINREKEGNQGRKGTSVWP